MSNEVYDFNIGHSTAYAYAKASGDLPEGMTPEEYGELLASYATVGQTAVTAAQTATTKASEAATSATTATNKATEATTAATTATTKAGEASTSASTATSAKDTAVSASQTATTKATEATTAAATATSAATTATTAKDGAVSAKTAAQTAQTGAETAAASVSASAAQIATNAADISQVKSDLNDLNDAVFDITEASINKYNSTLVTSETVYTDKKLYGNGTLKDATGIDVTPFLPINPSTTYWLGLVPSYGSTEVPWYGQSVAIEFYSAQSESSQISRIDRVDNNAITFTTPSNANYYRFNIARSSGISLSILNSRCMLVEGTIAPSEYVPYSDAIKTSKLLGMQDEIDGINSRISQFGTIINHHLEGTTSDGLVLIRNGTSVYEAAGLIHTTYTNISEYVGGTLSINGASNIIGSDGKAYVLFGFYDSNGNLLLSHESTANTYYSDVQVTVPQNAVKLIVNGVSNYTNYYPTALGYTRIEATGIIAYEVFDGSLYVSTKYNSGTLDVVFGKRGPNQLPDFKKITADGREKYNGSSDMHSPFTIKAVNNIDGDDVDTHTYTGGNHNYGNTGTTDYTATGRNISFDLYADGELLSDGDFGLATTIMIEWVNRVQGYNTRKSDGSGREIIEERHTIIFDGVNWVSTVELEPLEDVVIENYYGYQCPVSNYPNIHMIGADYKKVFVYSSPHDSGNNTPNMYVACSTDDRLEMEVDRSYDMGKGTYYSGTQGFRTIAGGKGYTFLISNLSAEEGDIYGARGIYRFVPNY